MGRRARQPSLKALMAKEAQNSKGGQRGQKPVAAISKETRKLEADLSQVRIGSTGSPAPSVVGCGEPLDPASGKRKNGSPIVSRERSAVIFNGTVTEKEGIKMQQKEAQQKWMDIVLDTGGTGKTDPRSISRKSWAEEAEEEARKSVNMGYI